MNFLHLISMNVKEKIQKHRINENNKYHKNESKQNVPNRKTIHHTNETN